MMRIVLLSDLHGHLPKVPECDLCILAGDYNCFDGIHDILTFTNGHFARWLESIPSKQTIGIAGNHDWQFTPSLRKYVSSSLHWKYLEDDIYYFQGLKIYGTPWVPDFFQWAFMRPDTEEGLGDVYADIPMNLDILITHGPPRGILDRNLRGDQAGSVELQRRLKSLAEYDAAPKLHVFGHIHEGFGIAADTTMYCNVAYVDRNYNPRKNVPVVLDL